MAKKMPDQRIFHVAVVGLSGTEKEKGVTGIGKSCLCNRFIRPHADDYSTEHISVISQSDFGGRVINNDHFLYWGQVTKTSDEGVDFVFQVVEQTEFIDDSSFLPFKIGKTDSYLKRCANVKLQSAEKLMYICKNQLGVENDYEQQLLPEGRFNVDGFLCLFDVSAVQNRGSLDWQVEYTTQILLNLVKTKKPVVLATTKNDDANDVYIREVEKLMNRKEFKGIVHLVETSAHKYINIEQAFLTLAHLIDRTKGRPKIVPYAEAVRARNEIVSVAKEAFVNLISTHITDYRATWASCRKLAKNSDYQHYVELEGTDEARKLFRQHQRKLKQRYVQQQRDQYLERLKVIIHELLPDLTTIADRSWPACIRLLQRRDDFEQLFVQPPEGLSWQDSEFLDSTESEKIPVEVLESEQAEMLFRNHLNALRAEQRRLELKKSFKQVLTDHRDVTPGKPLKEVQIFLLGHECFTSLSEEDKSEVYDTYQRELRDGAKMELQELLWENVHLFTDPNYAKFLPAHIEEIKSKLQDDPRYSSLHRLEQDRKMQLLSHLAFLQHPSWDKCPFRERCAERAVQQVLTTKAHRPQSWNKAGQFVLDASDRKVNMVLIGTNGLSDELIHEIRDQCVDDEFCMESAVYSLDYRPIDSDVSLPQNSLCTADFLPHGCFCTYNSFDSLGFIQESLNKTLLSALEEDSQLPYQGLPTVIVLGWDPRVTDHELEMLREEGRALAERLQCPFVDVPSSQMCEEGGRRFHPEQVTLAVRNLISCIQYRASFVQPWHITESLEPDLRILMCIMCADKYSVELPLMPLLNHQCCYVTSDRFPALTLEAYLDDTNVKIEVTIVSYHGASVVRHDLFHGYILVYHTKRKASYANLSWLASHIPRAPTKILAITDKQGVVNQNDLAHQLLLGGRAVADRLDAEFLTTMNDFQSDSSFYTPLFREAWDRKAETEQGFQLQEENGDNSLLDHMSIRPPAAMPGKMRYSNIPGLSDEPVYDQLRFENSDSDEGGDRVSSVSPPPQVDLSPYSMMDNELYSEIGPFMNDQEQLIKRSPAGNRKTPMSDQSDTPEWTESALYANVNKHQGTPPTKAKSRPKALEFAGHTFKKVSKFHGRRSSEQPQPTYVKAPIATPENIEILGDYAMVKDALHPNENNYASVQDALPAGKLHRIRSTFRKKFTTGNGDKGGTDSDSEFSSLEREAPSDLYNKVGRKPTPHKKKHYKHQRASDSGLPPITPPNRGGEYGQIHVCSDPVSRVRSNSPSDGSEGTGDEFTGAKKVKKRRSFRTKKKKPADLDPSYISPPFSDTDIACAPLLGRALEDENVYEPITPREKEDEVDEEMDSSGNWRKKLGFRTDPDKVKKKEEKKKIKEEEKRIKEQQKLQRKLKKKAGSISTPSQSSGVLEDLASSDTNPIPAFVIKCISFLEAEGMEFEGLYRVSGSRAHADQLVERFREDPDVDLSTLDIPISAVATALKGFFSDLSEPLFPVEIYEQLIEAVGLQLPRKRRKSLRDMLAANQQVPHNAGRLGMRPRSRSFSSLTGVADRTSRLLALRAILKKLPSANFEVLKYLIVHLHRVAQRSHENIMDSKNLAIVWWPTLFRPDIPSLEQMALVSRYLEEAVQTMIDQCRFFFFGEHEV